MFESSYTLDAEFLSGLELSSWPSLFNWLRGSCMLFRIMTMCDAEPGSGGFVFSVLGFGCSIICLLSSVILAVLWCLGTPRLLE